MIKTNLTALQRVERANIELLGHPATMAYAGVIMVGQYSVSSDIPTAYTDGINCKYGEKFVLGLTDAELRGVIMHETLHKTFQHLFLWQHLFKENARCANMAMDYVINLIIKDVGNNARNYIILPTGALLDERFRGMDSQQVFNILLDEHQKCSGKSQSSMDEHDWDNAKSLSEKEVEVVRREIDQAIRQGQMMAGKAGGDASRILSGLTEPVEDWRGQVSEFMTSSADKGDISTYRKVNRRWLQHDMYMPTTYSESMRSLTIAVDLSGSVGQEEFMVFVSHVVLMCKTLKPERVDLLYWDTNVNVHEVYFQNDLDRILTSTKPVGGGGTTPSCVPRYIEEHKLMPDCVIVLTDGYVDRWGAWKHPVLWGITGGNRVVPDSGKAIYIK